MLGLQYSCYAALIVALIMLMVFLFRREEWRAHNERYMWGLGAAVGAPVLASLGMLVAGKKRGRLTPPPVAAPLPVPAAAYRAAGYPM